MEVPEGKKIVLFDGVCNLCNRWVQRIIRRDSRNVFVLAPLQSEIGLKLTAQRGIDPAVTDSIVLINPGVAYYVKSDAALEIARHLNGYRWVPALLGWIPVPVRNGVYDLIARNRYRWYGRRESCMVPTPEIRGKFLA